MRRSSFKNLERAQGVVEFALVLPILLLIIFGIISFAHLFFSYTATVNASREAARFGSAVGVTANGIPAFQDCDAIIDHATTMGGIAGVGPTTVAISYDKGDPTTEYGSCPPGGKGPDAPLGDRIVVRMNVPYTPIVPLVNIPAMNLQAETRRTIVRALPVGEAPTAEPLCVATDILMSVAPEPSRVGEIFTVSVDVAGIDGTQPEDDPSSIFITTNPDVGGCVLDAPSGVCPLQAWAVGEYDIHARYDGYDGSEGCWEESELDMNEPGHMVIPSDTQTFLTTSPAGSSQEGNTVLATVHVQAVLPGQRQTWAGEKVTLTVSSTGTGIRTETLTLDSAGNASFPFPMNVPGTYILRANYPGDANYTPSEAEILHVVVPAPPPTAVCPNKSNITFDAGGDSLTFAVNTPGDPGAVSLDVVSVRVDWPTTTPVSRLVEFRFDATGNIDNSCSANSNASACIWPNKKNVAVSPPSFSADSSNGNWIGGTLPVNQQKFVRLKFSHALPSGLYRVTVNFTNNCQVTVEGSR